MTTKATPERIAEADRISDRIVDVINAEMDRQRASDTLDPSAVFAGQCLAFLAMLRTAPADRPPSLDAVEISALAYLDSFTTRQWQ